MQSKYLLHHRQAPPHSASVHLGMRVPVQQAIRCARVLMADGAIGTEVQAAGLEPGGCGEEWNVTHPERIFALHRNFIDAGSQLITTNTFGANRFVLSHYGLADRVAELARSGAELARRAMGPHGWVLGGVGPCGGFLQPLGEIAIVELQSSLREQMTALLEGGVDGIILETLTALDEMEIAIRIAREAGASLVIASVAYDRLRDGCYKTMMGVSPQQAARIAVAAGANMIGANCGTAMAPADLVAVAREYRAACDLPLVLQPNGGKPRLDGERVVYPLAPEEYAHQMLALLPWATIVGGCCGVSPLHIRALCHWRQTATAA